MLSAIGSLMYAVMCTRSDISFAVGLVSRYQSNQGPVRWQTVMRIFRYLRGTFDLVLCYSGGDLRLRGFCDADWASDRDERKSTSGNVFILGGGLSLGAARNRAVLPGSQRKPSMLPVQQLFRRPCGCEES